MSDPTHRDRLGAVGEGQIVGLRRGLPWLQADLPVDIPGALPGERVRYQELGRGAFRARGRLLSVLEPHPARVNPPCPLAQVCGGCELMMLAHPQQVALKHQEVAARLEPLGFELDAPLASPAPLAYRSRARFTFFEQGHTLCCGAFRAGTHDPIDVEGCPVTAPALLLARDALLAVLQGRAIPAYSEAQATGVLRHLVLQLSPASSEVVAVLVVADPGGLDWVSLGPVLLQEANLWLESRATVRLAGLVLNQQSSRGNALLGEHFRTIAGRDTLRLPLGEVMAQVPAGAFSQVNLEVAGALYRQAADWASGACSGLVLDLFCGVGALGFHLPSETRGLGIEWTAQAIEAARREASVAGRQGWTYTAGDVATVLSKCSEQSRPSLALVNPPRKGLGDAVVGQLRRLKPQRILYISCNPETLEKDVRELLSAGYRAVRARAFDMFPQTRHVETLAWLEWSGPEGV